MRTYADLAAKMDAGVDLHLGGSISYSVDGGTTYTPVQGFVLRPGETGEMGLQPMDALQSRLRVKINRSLIPHPSKALHRLYSDDLEGPGQIFRPRNTQDAVQGRYYIFEVEKV